MHEGHPAGRHGVADRARAPLNVYWETTRACALACRHCRAEAMPEPAPDELSPAEGLDLLRQVREFGAPAPQLVLTGGDPLLRADLCALLDEARRLEIPTAVTPAATPRLDRDVLARLAAHGVAGLGLSLDGATAEHHDGLRGVAGCWRRTLDAIGWAGELGLPLQVNTLVTADTAADLPAMASLLCGMPVGRWSLFFLIPVGRGSGLTPLGAAEAEALMAWLHERSATLPFVVATTEAPVYRRVVLERMRAAGLPADEIRRAPVVRSFGIRDGHGVVFVSSTGDVCPAGFLPLAAGNVRSASLVALYRDAPLFRALHAPERFHGKCGRCEYRAICGGSRARAWAATGDPLGTDPLCTYEPAAAA